VTVANDVAIEAGKSYFLHVAADGTEQRFRVEPENLYWKTHLVRIIAVEDDEVVEETTVTVKLPSPHGKGWEHVGNYTWRRTRPTR
jgi:hypothetical protein